MALRTPAYPPAQTISPVVLALIDTWLIDDERERPPLPLTGEEDPPGTPGVDTHPPFLGVGREGGVSGNVGREGGVNDRGVRRSVVKDGGVSDEGVGRDGGVSDEIVTVTEPPPWALVPAAEPAPFTLPTEGEAVAFRDAWPPPPGGNADDGRAAVLRPLRAL